MNILDILLVILIFTTIILVIYTIYTLRNINDNITKLNDDIHNLSSKVIPVIENLDQITKQASYVTNNIENQWDDFKSSINQLKTKFLVFNRNSNEHDENPILRLKRNLQAISKGIIAFIDRLKS